MQVCIISTSPRKGSNSLRFSNYIGQIIENQGNNNVSIVSFEDSDIPFFGHGQTVDKNNPTPFQAQLLNAWAAADLVFVVTPEYNWMPSPEFVNALNILGGKDFAHLFHNKTFALAGVSSGRGGKIPCTELTTILNKVINFLHQYSIVSPRIFEAHETHRNLNENNASTGNQIFENGVVDFVTYSLTVANRWSASV
jgi:chromate reductase, NAD(P)H dehydrogenase (quinone)